MIQTGLLCFSLQNNSKITSKNSNKASISSSFNLFDLSFNVFELLKKDFTISTNNGSYKFNSNMLKDTSVEICNSLIANPENYEYHLNLDDPKNIMSKIEQLYQGKRISIVHNELLFIQKMIEILKINSFPSIFRSSRVQTDKNYLNLSQAIYHVEINELSLVKFMQYNFGQTNNNLFIISIEDKQYQCNIYGIRSSKKINELIIQNPSLQLYNYNIIDEFSDFQVICDLFNFNKINITSNNMYSIKKFADDLQIECIIEKVDNFINSYENAVQVIDDKQFIVDEFDQIFELLYNRNNKTIDSVKDSIIRSKWIKSEEEVQELASCFNQVINNCGLLHQQFLYDLIISLDLESEKFTHLKLLIPSIVTCLLTFFSSSKLNCGFIYKMHKHGYISKDVILNEFDKLMKCSPDDNKYLNDLQNCCLWFLPEIIDYFQPSELHKSDLFHFLNDPQIESFLNNYFPDKLNEYKKMRDFGQIDFDIEQALIHDDVDSLQKAVCMYDITKKTAHFSIFDEFIKNEEISLINFAAAYGSIHCFKYLLLNNSEIDKFSLYYAVSGGNYEIIRTIDQYYTQENFEIDFYNDATRKKNLNGYLDPIVPAIYKHQNDLFDWILQEKYINKGETGIRLSKLLPVISMNGNAHSLIELINNGLDLNAVIDVLFCKSIGLASFGGFYKYIQLFYSFIEKPKFLAKKNIENSVILGNLSIFKFIIQKDQRYTQNFNDTLFIAIDKNHFNIIKFIVENYFKDDIKLTSKGLYKCLQLAMKFNSDVFRYLINNFDFNRIIVKYYLIDDDFIALLINGCLVGNLENVKFLTKLIIDKFPNANFMSPFIAAIENKFVDICKFFIEQKVPLDLITFSKELINLKSIDEKIFYLLIKDADQEKKDILFGNLMYKAIELHNKNIVEFLLTQDIRYDDILFKAVNSGDIEIVKIILKYNDKPSFINKVKSNGTVLHLATNNNDLEMVKFLLTVPGINPNLVDSNKNTPLTITIFRLKIDIMNAFLDYYGDNIQSQMWQINRALFVITDDPGILKDKDKFNENKNIYDRNNVNTIINASSIIKNLLKIKNLDLNCTGNYNTLLTYACQYNDFELVKMLVESNTIDVNSYALIDGCTPLLVAIIMNNVQISEYLIELPQTNINMQNYYGETALTLAVSNDMRTIIHAIIDSEKFDPVESELDRAFYISEGFNALQLIKVKGLDVNYRKPVEIQQPIPPNDHSSNNSYLFDTSLTYAVKKENVSKIQMIVNHSSFNAYKSHIKQALFLAAEKDQIEIFRTLLPFVDNDVNISFQTNKSLLIHSVENRSEKIIDEIIHHESFDPLKSDLLTAFVSTFNYIKEENQEGTSLYDSMVSIFNYDNDHSKLIDFKKLLPNGKSYFTSISYNYSDISQVADFFLQNGCDPDAPDQNGIYPLEYAITLNSVAFVRLLIGTGQIDLNRKLTSVILEFVTHTGKVKGPNKNIITKNSVRNNLTYLHLAAKKRDPTIFNYLLSLNVIDINSVDDRDETLLFFAIKYYKPSIIQKLFLLDDLDYKHQNKRGMDAIKYAQHLISLNSERNIQMDQNTEMKLETKGDYLTEILSILNLFEALK